jgi:phenylacetate-CoA ligase
MRVLDELNIVELLDENNRSVSSGREGRVVLTNLYNYTLPIIRYELGDYGVRGTANRGSRVTTIRDITGRANDALPVVLRDGRSDAIYPITLTAFHVAHLEKIQFLSKRPDHVRIDYVASLNIDAAVRDHFQKMLDSKGAVQTKFEVQRVPQIENDPATGKLNLVKVQHENRLDL